ncbi:hypothetical protein FJ987_14670 [Mesorhizobium sp. CU2]|uniref:hypothetical protein n=1 Tax=unclassified Mesorhizobium TaxID=325217 RepID=UPI00112DB732|nr:MULTISPECIES: hypothetical protein [unclassified Mesorhizobium]TPN85678.1 hypothetical protein FJ988_08985 [Mesorhizobium sp. CU3]TPO14152.1 hypothetical protein FJ987_14670 [Mesorhizobium sp. CU2]
MAAGVLWKRLAVSGSHASDAIDDYVNCHTGQQPYLTSMTRFATVTLFAMGSIIAALLATGWCMEPSLWALF